MPELALNFLAESCAVPQPRIPYSVPSHETARLVLPQLTKLGWQSDSGFLAPPRLMYVRSKNSALRSRLFPTLIPPSTIRVRLQLASVER